MQLTLHAYRRVQVFICFFAALSLALTLLTGCGGCGSGSGPAPASNTKPAIISETDKVETPVESAPTQPETPSDAPTTPTVSSPQTPDSSASASAPATGSAAAPGDVSGVIMFEGEPQKRTVVDMKADPKCAAIHGDKKVGTEQVIVSKTGQMANVFVYVKKGLEGRKFNPPAAPATLDQHGCMYVPHVQGIMVKQKLNIVNSDATVHNVHALALENPEFNISQPNQGTREVVFQKAEIGLKFKCDVHPWMNSWVHVLEHPHFAVSGKDGVYVIRGLAPGKYTIEAWHEVYGSQQKEIEVGSAPINDAGFIFSAPQKK